LPIRIIQYGNILIALDKTNVLLIRSIIEAILAVFLSILFYHLFGIFGIAFGVVISVVFWTVPYNMVIISKGFGIPLWKIIPSKKLLNIMICSTVAGLIIFLVDYLVVHDISTL